MSDEAERSDAMRGVHTWNAWAVVGRGRVRDVCCTREGAVYARSDHACDTEIVKMVAITDEEREALQWAVIAAETFRNVPAKQPWGLCDSSVSSEQANKYGATLRGFLERLQ